MSEKKKKSSWFFGDGGVNSNDNQSAEEYDGIYAAVNATVAMETKEEKEAMDKESLANSIRYFEELKKIIQYRIGEIAYTDLGPNKVSETTVRPKSVTPSNSEKLEILNRYKAILTEKLKGSSVIKELENTDRIKSLSYICDRYAMDDQYNIGITFNDPGEPLLIWIERKILSITAA